MRKRYDSAAPASIDKKIDHHLKKVLHFSSSTMRFTFPELQTILFHPPHCNTKHAETIERILHNSRSTSAKNHTSPFFFSIFLFLYIYPSRSLLIDESHRQLQKGALLFESSTNEQNQVQNTATKFLQVNFLATTTFQLT